MTTKEMIEVMQAYERGEQIEYRIKDFMRDDEWYVQKEFPEWDWKTFDYRVKKQFTYRPYKNIQEFLQAQKEHGIYLQEKETRCMIMPLGVNYYRVTIPSRSYRYKQLLNTFVWQDGTPCGVKEE